MENTLDKYDKVELIPWDPENEQQFQRMVDQRHACGWNFDEVDLWKESMLKNEKFLFWVTPVETLPGREVLLKDHVGQYPEESEPLVDTATVVFNTPRQPSKKAFTPIGHIGLQLYSERNIRFSIPLNTLWVKSLYISGALQASGLGRSAMAQLETLASRPPFNCTVLALDVMQEAFQLSDLCLSSLWDERGLERPKVVRSALGWYQKQGYGVVGIDEDAYTWRKKNGECVPVPVVYLTKSLV